jgi:hypothetical protein
VPLTLGFSGVFKALLFLLEPGTPLDLDFSFKLLIVPPLATSVEEVYLDWALDDAMDDSMEGLGLRLD